jgi:hypothetical protein
MRTAMTMSMVVLGGVLFAGSANAGCELTCEGECRQVAALCKLDAALDARADKVACSNEANEALVECHAIQAEGHAACSELCGVDFKACKQEVNAEFKACKVEVAEGLKECKLEAAGAAALAAAACFTDKATCLAECAGDGGDGGDGDGGDGGGPDGGGPS